MTNGLPAFEPLSRLFRGDRDRIRRTLDVFLSVTRSDLELLDGAYDGGNWTEIARLMHKMKSGCQQIGENGAADAAVAVENALKSGVIDPAAFATAREALGQVEQRVARYLAMDNR